MLTAADHHPRQNRVTPFGDIVAIPLRGAWMGNRGQLHSGGEIVRFSRNRAWITCVLQYKDWTAPQWTPGHYTPLFFHDETVSLAAGHRPCALCRRAEFQHYRSAATAGTGDPAPMAQALDGRLHSERLITGTRQRRLHSMSWSALPDGTFVVLDERPTLVFGAGVFRWTTNGYLDPAPRPTGTAQVLTPPTSVRALSAGYRVQIDQRVSARPADNSIRSDLGH